MADAQVYVEDVEPGDAIPEIVKRCTPRQLVMWASASGDFYEIHYDVEYARSIGLPGLVVHGALKNAFLGHLLHEWVAPAGRIVRYGCSYRGMDYPEQDLRCRGKVTEISTRDGEGLIDVDIWIENPSGEVTTPGTATVSLPSRGREER
ncbi:MAG TPA: MaoC/PaaZ C-terminal domain-containing protein [Actinomycetota bacterium]|nr:MaoC/PaaZ C-terminal domain-containing protein [Actinomycetota bacterium]